ncbi:MAG: DUF429 domain-containing protein [Gammaproteobacteria bacterium]|nr:DUF429 domain-containing protein [Gammaproteobacteria bacterium]NIR99044.1 DUF429 domain-containing protein [Gammaproteobacteria bacterium]NIT64667.1 DUF429 domain-containing protein [Gammaproteobacteria bacterium]NIY33247.1 DUF429 domain-containing protein [Gammaproteobacteria bacterium]
MHSTRDFDPPPYLGVDLTSRYGHAPRPNDVCGLVPLAPGRLRAYFWHWRWDHPPPQPPDVGPLLKELRRARCVMIDGPQALAALGCSARASERACHTPARTPDREPSVDRPYGGFIRSAVALFEALARAGLAISPPELQGGIHEFYPAYAWRCLAGERLARKQSPDGRRQRGSLLKDLGVELPRGFRAPHDQNDACLGAVLAAAADGRVPGVRVEALGEPLRRDRCGSLREGPIVVPRLDSRC